LVSSFTEADAAQLSALIAELKTKGQQLKFFDAAIAATVMARGDKLLVLDTDFDRLKDRIQLLRPPTPTA
jgi:predicted nucleic acid-binding protein